MKVFCFVDELYVFDGVNYKSKYNSVRFLLNLVKEYDWTFSFPLDDNNNLDNFSTVIPKYIDTVPLPYWDSMISYYKNKVNLKKEISSRVEKAIDSCDVVWVRLPSPAGNLIMDIAKKKNKKIICHFATDILSVYKKYNGIKKILAYNLGKLIHLCNKKFIDKYENVEVLCTGRHLEKAYSHKNTKFFIDTESEVDFKKNKLKTKNFIYVGRLIESKGIKELVEAWNKANLKEANLFIVGHGEMKSFIDKESEKNKSIKSIGFATGKDLKELYEKSDCLILPTTTFPEGFPRVIAEAWCTGIAVISTDVGGIRSLGVDNENIIFSEPGNVDELSKSIEKIYYNEDLLIKLQEGGMRTADLVSKNNMLRLVRKVI